jgi:hypothetical protein
MAITWNITRQKIQEITRGKPYFLIFWRIENLLGFSSSVGSESCYPNRLNSSGGLSLKKLVILWSKDFLFLNLSSI